MEKTQYPSQSPIHTEEITITVSPTLDTNYKIICNSPDRLLKLTNVRPAMQEDIPEIMSIMNDFRINVLKCYPLSEPQMRYLFVLTTKTLNLPFVVYVQDEDIAGKTPMILGCAYPTYFYLQESSMTKLDVKIFIMVRKGYAFTVVSPFLLYAIINALKAKGRDALAANSTFNILRMQTLPVYPIRNVYVDAFQPYVDGWSIPWKKWGFKEAEGTCQNQQSTLYCAELDNLLLESMRPLDSHQEDPNQSN